MQQEQGRPALAKYAQNLIIAELNFAKATTTAVFTVSYLLADPRLAEVPKLSTVVPRAGSVSSATQSLLFTDHLFSQLLNYDQPKDTGNENGVALLLFF